MKKFGFGILTGFAGTIAGIAGVFFIIYIFARDRLPAPALTPIVQIDEKLNFIRNNPQIDPHILAVGSSITFRHLNGNAFRNVAGGRLHFLNGGVVHLQIDETEDLTNFYLDNYPHVRTVLMLTGLPDFEDCSSQREPMLDPDSARGFSFERYPAVFYYLRYFSPQRYVRGIMEFEERRTPFYGDIYIDEFGSGPVKVRKGTDYGLRYGEIDIDPACVDALVRFAEDLDQRGKDLAVIFTPIHPEYREQFPASVDALTHVIAEVQKRVPDTTFVSDMHKNAGFVSQDFYDAFHLVWAGAQRLSDIIVVDLEHWHTDNAIAAYNTDDRRQPLQKSRPQSLE